MGEKKYTEMQQAAIDIRNSNILVSAAAGSGKTAVLVQRIIDRILSESNPIDIDRILVMTFTKAAAAQMKERILDAINQKRSENPHDKNLNKQYALVHNAYIMTIDSFCMNVVKNHFEEINLSPDFRMADEGEVTLIRQDVLSSVLEEFYESMDEKFLNMTEIFSSSKTDYTIEKIVLSLYDFAVSYPDPMEWLEKCADEYRLDIKSCADYEWLNEYVEGILSDIRSFRNILDEAGDMCRMEYGPLQYEAAINSDIDLLDRLISASDYEQLYQLCVEASVAGFQKMASVRMPKGSDVTEAEIEVRTKLKDRVYGMRDKCKKAVSSIINSVSNMSPMDVVSGMHKMKEPVEALIELTKAFYYKFDEKKREKNIVDFNDLEHMCLDILRKGKDTTALEYSEFFEEIYVDEYQDSNFVQEEIVNLISKRDKEKGNVFMVGDVKQSIYGFRNAKPEIFIDKYDRFEAYSSHDEMLPVNVKVDLSHNFRSRHEVLDSINNIFKKIMKKELGGIAYDEAASLHVGRDFVETESDYVTELNLMVSDDEISDKEAEALMVANRIKELMGNMLVEDQSYENGVRPLKYSDIVILLRTAKGWDTVFMETLASQGIPVFVTSSTGYFEAMEVKSLINFLKIIDNPLQDIPLAQVLMSVIGGFFEEEVAKIRGAFKDGYLYEALVRYLESYDESNDTLINKIDKFVVKLNYYRKKSGYTSVADILTEIIDGEYGKIIKAMPSGTKKTANLNMLLKKAMEYEKTSYKGIFQFNRYIEAIRKYEIDYGEANISDESDDTVRIMSIHKSKGLEFPVCFLSGLNKKFNMMDTRDTVLTDNKYGIAVDIIDIDRRVKSKSAFKMAIAKKKQQEIIAEELRLLYVAMTRAKEKLIMTGAIKNEQELPNSLVTIEKASSYMDMYACASEAGMVEDVNVSYITTADLVANLVSETVNNEISRNRLLSIIDGKTPDIITNNISDETNNNNCDIPGNTEKIDIDIIKERLLYNYPYEDKGSVKLSVSELKHKSEKISDEDAIDEASVSKELYESSGPSIGALHGTAVHRIFEIWDYNRPATESSVREFLKYVKEEMLMEEDLFETLIVSEIVNFVSSDIAKRMGDAYKNGELYREQPFVICDDENDSESMLVQGIIDAYFIEDGQIVLVDYKTDKGTNEVKLKEAHGVQLDYYGKALTRLLGLELKEKIIYSTYLKKSISI